MSIKSQSRCRRRPVVLLLVLVTMAIMTRQDTPAQSIGKRVGPQFSFLTSSARAFSLADAGSSILDDFSGFGSNPAILGHLKRSSIDYSVHRVKQGISFEHLGIAYKTTSNDGLAISLDILHYGGADFYTNSSVRNLGFELKSGFAYGRKLGESLSLGVNMQAWMTTTGVRSVWAFTSDFGVVYAPEKYVRYGMFLKGMGSDYDIGSSLLATDVFSSRIPRVLGLGATLDFPFSARTKRILLTLQNEKVFGEREIIYKLGLEYSPYYQSIFQAAVRGGILVRGSQVEPRFGLGLSYEGFSLDYAYKYSRRESQPGHILTLSFKWM